MKKIDPKIIIGGGFGSCGLSALTDLLEEVDDFYVTPQEFVMFNDPDGLISLESALIDNWSVFQGNVAIRRFLKLTQVLSNKYASPYPGLDYTLGNEFRLLVSPGRLVNLREELVDNWSMFRSDIIINNFRQFK